MNQALDLGVHGTSVLLPDATVCKEISSVTPPFKADVCHAYQIAHQNGIPDDQIVVMMYDDIAYNEK